MSQKMPFGLKIAIIHRAFRKKMDEKAAMMGLTSVQLRVLGSVSRLEEAGIGEIHQKDLEKIEHVTHPAMTKFIQKLEKKGYIRCVPSQTDRRYKKIIGTEKSKGIHKMIFEQDEEVLAELCKDFTREQKENLIETIDMIFNNIDFEWH